MATEITMRDLLQATIDEGASDLHVRAFMPPELRIHGELVAIADEAFTAEETRRLCNEIMTPEQVAEAESNGGTDFALAHEDGTRFRVSVFKERGRWGCVLRMIPSTLLTLEQIGLPPSIKELLFKPRGLILVTGPTGSGKSTSLYSFLHEVNTMDVRILTAEDPIEYQMDGIIQVQMNKDIGLDFARTLRAFLRQDPDKIMVGEIRDRETAEIAINASLTGHMVFSTLHTNTAAGAFPRMIDMGVEPFLIASAVAGVMGQRLCRRLCPTCRREVPLDRKWYDLADPPARDTVFEPAEGGCDACSRTGYKGRRALFEVLEVDEDIESAIIKRENATQIQHISLSKGMKTLREDGWAKVFKGVTSVAEIRRVTEDQ